MKHYNFCEFEHERKAFQELESYLGKHAGAELYPNYELFDEGKNVYLECDLVLIGKSFCAIIELKHWYGHIQIQPNHWYRGNSPVDDPHRTNNYKCKVLKSVISKQLTATRKLPYVQSIVVLTNPKSDVEGDDRAKYILDKENYSGQITFNGMSELANYISKRLGHDGSTGKNILTDGELYRLTSYFDKCFDRPKRDYTDQIPGYSILEEIEHTDRYVSYMAEKKPPIGKRKYRLRVFGKLSSDPSEREYQQRSLMVLNSLNFHPNIRLVHSVPNEHNLIVEESEWGDGQTLEKKLIEGGVLSWRVAAKITLGLARALEHIHDQALVHRNICPKTVLLNRDNEPELCDFDVVFNPDSSLTVFGDETAISMSSPYMSPEVFDGNPDSKSDVYSLGVLLYEMLTGKHPNIKCSNHNVSECFDVEIADELPSDLPDEIKELLNSSICCDRDNRYESSEIVLLLDNLFNEEQPISDDIVNEPYIGQIFNTYQIKEQLATGSTSEVFLADNSGYKEVLKIYSADYPKERCLEERDMLSRITSSNVPSFRTFIQWSGQRWCLIEEAIDGKSLREEIELEKYPSLNIFKQATIQLLMILESMHPSDDALNANVIHNDINPSNVLISKSQDKFWLIDFGVASEPGPVSFRGTLGYVDKNLLDGGNFEACPQGDLYGLGITLLEWSTGSKSIPVDLNMLANTDVENNELYNLCEWFNKIFNIGEESFNSATDMRNQFEAIFFQTKVTQQEEQEQEQEDLLTFHERKTSNLKSGGESVGQFSDHFVSYLNSIHNLGANNKYALAEAQAISEYFGEMYEPFSVAETIYERLIQDEDIVIVLTGHAGDGKSALALDILKKLRGISSEQRLDFVPKDIEKVELGSGKIISILKDMSEQPSDNRRSIIENSLKKGSGNWLIVSNTGPLLKAFSEYIDDSDSINLSQIELENQILGALNFPIIDNVFNDDHALKGFPKSVVLANLTKVDNIDIAVKLLKKMGNHSEWKKCEECLARSYCHIYSNVGLMKQSDSPVFERVAWLYQRLNEYDSRMTLRQMAAHLAFSLTGGQECKEIREQVHLINSEEGQILELRKYC